MRLMSARGYSFVELLAVLAIISTLALLAAPMVQLVSQRQREQDLRRALWEIREALDRHRRSVEEGLIEAGPSGYPATLGVLVTGRPNLKRQGERVYFLRRVPRDPFAPEHLSAERTWGLRSYRSSPDRPVPGDDVFDVFSLAEGAALDGVAYRDL